MKKSLLITLSLISAAIFAKGYVDSNFMDDSFMADNEIHAIERVEAVEYDREVASANTVSTEKLDFPVNSENEELINKVWTVKAYTYNFGEAEVMNTKVNFELVGNGLVMIGNDEELVYEMIAFGGNSVRLIKEVEGGNEIIEAVVENKVANKVVNNEENEAKKVIPGLSIEEDMDLVLVKAVNVEEEMDASLSISTEGSIHYFTVNGVSVDTTDLKVGGLFNGEYNGQEVSGRISNDGSKDKYLVRFFTGDLRGVALHFENAETASNDQVITIKKVEEQEEVRREITEEEMQLHVEETGFNFNN